MPTGWLAEPGFGPINSSGERLCLPLSFQLGSMVRLFFPAHSGAFPELGSAPIHLFIHSLDTHLSSANLIPACTAP